MTYRTRCHLHNNRKKRKENPTADTDLSGSWWARRRGGSGPAPAASPGAAPSPSASAATTDPAAATGRPTEPTARRRCWSPCCWSPGGWPPCCRPPTPTTPTAPTTASEPRRRRTSGRGPARTAAVPCAAATSPSLWANGRRRRRRRRRRHHSRRRRRRRRILRRRDRPSAGLGTGSRVPIASPPSCAARSASANSEERHVTDNESHDHHLHYKKKTKKKPFHVRSRIERHQNQTVKPSKSP